MKLTTLIGEPWSDYGLIDSGDGLKFERYGPYRFVRPEPQAMWAPAQPAWDSDGAFVPGSDEDGGGRWIFERETPKAGWKLGWDDISFTAQTTPFRHLGFFPDMMPVWEWARGKLTGKADPTCLNLFGYTGVGSLALASAGAMVTHVDASKKSVEAAKGNARLSGLSDKPIRWLIDDATKFTAREVRRGKRYDGIILDPPKYGRGPEGEVWQLETDLAALIANVRALVDENSSFVFLTVYAIRMSALSIGELLRQSFADLPGTVECGELGVREEARSLILPTAIWARWSA
ncbi:class I SAM-dependent rRNA methyltransferase [Sphingomonas paeninsulae]|uniref:Class I SAM-dependent rRNA methyltransferase n=1 Tax=Sphingomonas paeninsulae TaxID=2319844 RepID=A0A494TA49_SPHPE|nr:class I SAM-dependent methyltransferase [Sphingomonas paeninsulae]AYJ86277.1 class I SAM-dependent rRNA methyltransferase [Sphingomonas paeninsulae]